MMQKGAAAPRAGFFDLGVSHLALAVCRILYHAAVFWLMLDLWLWRRAAFAEDAAAAVVLLPLALVANAALVLGLWTRPFQVLNAVLARAIFALCLDSYTADEVIENVSLLFALAPAPRALSLDSWRRGESAPLDPVPRWFVLLLFTSLALIYGAGLRAKLASEVWRSGAGAYGLIALMVIGQLSLSLRPGRPRNLLCRTLGLYDRSIFVDWHFRLPGPLLRLTAVVDGQEIPIPSFDRQGYPTTHDRYWKLFGFTLRAGGDLREPVVRYAEAWLTRSGHAGAEIRAYCRDASVRSLSLDFTQDDEHRRRPWMRCGRFVSPSVRP